MCTWPLRASVADHEPVKGVCPAAYCPDCNVNVLSGRDNMLRILPNRTLKPKFGLSSGKGYTVSREASLICDASRVAASRVPILVAAPPRLSCSASQGQLSRADYNLTSLTR